MEHRLLNGVRVYAPTTRQALIDHAFAHRSLLVAVNAEKILHATEETRDIINRNVGYPDGIGAVMGLKKKGLPDVVKIPGCELWLDIVRAHYQDKSFYLVGGKDAVIEETVRRLREDFPGIRIVNHRNGYLQSGEERQALIDDVAATRPDVVFVAMGSPRQELLMEEMCRRHCAVYQGLGGSFDLYVGITKRTPDWWIRYFKWEGLYRSVSDATNLARWRRQLIIIRFLRLLYRNKL